MRTMKRYISQHKSEFKISNIESEGFYIVFKMESSDSKGLLESLNYNARVFGIDAHSLVGESESPVFEKYDAYIPSALLRKAYAEDRLCPEEVAKRLEQISNE